LYQRNSKEARNYNGSEGKLVISADDLEVERLSALDEQDMMIITEGYQFSSSDERDPPRLTRRWV
jgi:hypothetical protein